MNPRQIFRRKIAYLVAIALLWLPIFWLSHPATRGGPGSPGRPGGHLAQLQKEHHFSQAELGQIDPSSETIKLVTLGMRGIAADILWWKADRYKMKNDFDKLSTTLQQITKLQPNFIQVWDHQAWNLAYNVAAAFDDYRDKYHWVKEGIRFLQEGIRHNERDVRLPGAVGRFLSQKMGRADEQRQFRRLFRADDEFRAEVLPPKLANDPNIIQDPRDNWQAGKAWYLVAEDLVETKGVPIKGKSPLMFYSDAPLCQLHFAAELEKDGHFGDVARRAWQGAGAEWHEFGKRAIAETEGRSIHLNDREEHEAKEQEFAKQVENMAPPGTRAKIAAEKLAQLSAAEQKAWNTPAEKRTPKQRELAALVAPRLEVACDEIALRVAGEKRREARQLAAKAAHHRQMAAEVNGYRSLVNFDYWRLRAQAEQTKEAIEARKTIWDGDQADAAADLVKARDFYEKGLAGWRKVLDRFPKLKEDEAVIVDELYEMIQRYRRILEKSDKPFPKPFILQDILDAAGKRPRR